MCGIVGIIAKKEFSVRDQLVFALKRLEYRGYDSWGFATLDGTVEKKIGHIPPIKSIKEVNTTIGIAHTRWATHGGVTEINSHPHFNSDKTIFAVHNGIIENYLEIKGMLESKGYRFITGTDTEIIPHYFDYQLKKGKNMKNAIQLFIKEIKGTFGIALFRKGDDKIYAMKRDSPLVLGFFNGTTILASDIYAFSSRTNKAIFFDDNEYAVLSPDSCIFYNATGKVVKKKLTEFEWSQEEKELKHFKHYMIKEIKEQPFTSKRLIQSFKTTQEYKLLKLATMIKKSKRVVFVAAGTSYHASLVGVSLLNKVGIESHTVIASEFQSFMMIDEKNTGYCNKPERRNNGCHNCFEKR